MLLLPALYGCHPLLLVLLRIAWSEFWLRRFCIVPQLQQPPAFTFSYSRALRPWAVPLPSPSVAFPCAFAAVDSFSNPPPFHDSRRFGRSSAIPPTNFSSAAVARTRPPGRALSFFNKQTTKASVAVRIGPFHRVSRRP